MNLKTVLISLLICGFALPDANAQVVNFEETWLAFLKDNKISNISKMPQPGKDETENLAKYCLMYANSRFCEGNYASAKNFMRKIKDIGETSYSSIPGFKGRHDDLSVKMEAYIKADMLWKNFLLNKSVDEADLDAAEMAIRVCEKGTLAKYSYMQAHTYYCQGDVKKSRDRFENYTLKIVDKTSLRIDDVEGLKSEVENMRQIFKALDILDKSWTKYIETDVSNGFKEDLPEMDCYSIPSMKAYLLIAAEDVCKYGAENLKKIQRLKKTNIHDINTELAEKIEWLEGEVATYNGDITALNKAWKEFVPAGKVKTKLDFDLIYCEKEAQIRSYLINGTINVCTLGKGMLGKIAEVQAEHNPKLTSVTTDKLEILKQKVNTIDDNLKILNKNWTEFLEKDTLLKIDFAYEYCDKADEIKAYTMNGLVNICSEGMAMLAKIEVWQKEFNPELEDILIEKIAILKTKAPKLVADAENLKKLWKTFIANQDTLTESYELSTYYCDKVQQIQSWVLEGNFESCVNGQTSLDRIDAFQKIHHVILGKELNCRIRRLKIKVWDCRYWELVMQARKETHEERERFGPESTASMHDDLNGEDLPCETTVSYYPLGNIGIKYVITAYLCQNIDLAKMGDPEYYQKIATWVDTEVLQYYCEPNMRCKEAFFVYLEGHTDGNPFSGARYKKSLGIPKGTPFRHLTNEEINNIVTEREITNSLKNNMELGIARAWTVKNQLNFMNVPISIGAYEHPVSEKGGEYRRIVIELNMTNLLLDFYEKLLNKLLEESGIGERLEEC
ncbi:MAG: hypothetical protein ACJAUH_000461 [Saprospiraceae bacterium]|jgi:hypothetical protein